MSKDRPLKPYEIDKDVIDLDAYIDHFTETHQQEFIEMVYAEGLFDNNNTRENELVFIPDDDTAGDFDIDFTIDTDEWDN